MNALRTAIVAIVEADGPQGTVGTIQNLCGRTSDLLRAVEPLSEAVIPITTYLLVDTTQGGGSGDQRDVLAQFDAWADAATGGIDTAERMADRLEAILTQPALLARGVDAAPLLITRRDGTELEDDVTAGRRRVTLEIHFALQRA